MKRSILHLLKCFTVEEIPQIYMSYFVCVRACARVCVCLSVCLCVSAFLHSLQVQTGGTPVSRGIQKGLVSITVYILIQWMSEARESSVNGFKSGLF